MRTVVFPAIHERTKLIEEERRTKFNQSNHIINIPEGTAVMVRLPTRSHKLAPLYEGPYLVIRRKRGGTYVLKDEQNEPLHREYVPSELKVVSIDESESEDGYVEIDEIREHRGEGQNIEYPIKYKGYGERENEKRKRKDIFSNVVIDKYWQKFRELNRLKQQEKQNVISRLNKRPANLQESSTHRKRAKRGRPRGTLTKRSVGRPKKAHST